MEHVANPHVREKLLLKDKLTLAEAITIATQVESASEQAKFMAGDNQLPVHVVKAQDTACRPRQLRRNYSTKVANKPASASSTRACFRCGSQKHMANSRECPATKVTCRNCNKNGHFARVCQSKLTQSVKEVDLPEYTLLLVDGTEKNRENTVQSRHPSGKDN